MPGLPAPPLLNTLTDRSTTNTTKALQVICAFPLSGQYGPGSRFLYYAFVATSVFRKREWVKTACFAATMLFPAVAALHGIVLAAVNVKGAVDMDIYGAFQICAIGLVAAPITILLHPAYFHDLGRKTIFLWTYFILAGLVCLSVEFHRETAVPCTSDDFGNPISPIVGMFPYGNATCGLTCSVNDGPYSPIRSGSTNNIYVVPAPSTFTSRSAILVAVASCGPAAIMIFVMFNGISIFEEDGKTRIEDRGEEGPPAQVTEDSSSTASRGNVKIITLIRRVPKTWRYLPFIGTALNILIAGEINFFSPQIRYQNEPMSSIGEWAPIIGTGFALLVAFVQGRLDEDRPTSSSSGTEHRADITTDQHRSSRLRPTDQQSNRPEDPNIDNRPMPGKRASSLPNLTRTN